MINGCLPEFLVHVEFAIGCLSSNQRLIAILAIAETVLVNFLNQYAGYYNHIEERIKTRERTWENSSLLLTAKCTLRL